jgi:hypothetical protein
LPPTFADSLKLRRGLVGAVDIVGVKRYPSLEEFHADRERHLAPDDWFADGGMFGWILENPSVVPFEPCPGNLRFFRV